MYREELLQKGLVLYTSAITSSVLSNVGGKYSTFVMTDGSLSQCFIMFFSYQ